MKLNTFLAWATPVAAVLLLALMLVPAEAWDEPETDRTYRGFDSNLIFVKEEYRSSAHGDVSISPEALELTAMPGSNPLAHLATTPLDRVAVQMDLRITEAPPGTQPLRIGIWGTRAKSGFFITFTGGARQLVSAEGIVDGQAASTLIGGHVTASESLGEYELDQLQHLEIAMDKDAGVISAKLSRAEVPPSGHAMLRLAGGPADPRYSDVVSDAVPVRPGARYEFGSVLKMIAGADAYKVAVQWLDADEEHLAFSGEWRGAKELTPSQWTERRFTAVAPAGAARARIYLGSGNGTRLLFADVFLREVTSQRNLLANGDFGYGGQGWQFVGGAPVGESVIEPHVVTSEATITREEMPALFDTRRLTLTVSAASSGALSSATLSNYQLALPHDRFYGVIVDDPALDAILSVLLAIAAALLALRLYLLLRARPTRAAQIGRPRSRDGITIAVSRLGLWCVGAVVAYLGVNVLLAALGSHPFDMGSEKFWSYIAVRSGPDDLYYQPNLVSLAKVWQGGPWHEGVFPYGPPMAYLFTGIGWVYKLLLNGPGPLAADTFSAELTIKGVIVLFGLADAVLIYRILGEFRVSQRWALTGAAFFLFNPAVWFSMSVWGQTHVISAFFMLLSIWLTQRNNAPGAWLALATGALTRPQMIVPAFLLGVVLLRRFPLKENVQAISLGVLIGSIVLAPLSFAVSPSLPIDILLNQFYFQEAGGNEAEQSIISLGAYTIWPLASSLFDGAEGALRFSHPSSDLLIGPITYHRASSILAGGAVLLAAALIASRPASGRDLGRSLPIVCMGTLAFFVFKTGLAGTHLVLALPLLILMVHQLRKSLCLLLAGVWSLTTLISMYGGLASALSLSDIGYLAPLLAVENNPVSDAVMRLYKSDWFISAAVVGNLIVFVWLSVEALRAYLPASPARTPELQPSVAWSPAGTDVPAEA